MHSYSEKLSVGAWLVCVAIGQQAPPSAVVTQRLPTFRAGVELVEVAVGVTDRNGKPIRDLTVGEFDVIEGGRRQAISIFQQVQVPPYASSLRHPLPGTNDIGTNDFSAETRTIVLVLDDLHIDVRRTTAVRKIIRQLIERYIAPNDLVAVTTTSGRAQFVQDFTTDKSRILQVADRVSGLKPPFGSFLDAVHDARAAMGTISNLADHLAEVRARRIAILFISEGRDYNIYNPTDPKAMDVVRATERAIDALKRASITLYAIDPRGLAPVEEAEPEGLRAPPTPASGHGLRTPVTAPDARERLRLSIDNLRQMAESTGGFAAVNSNDYERAFERIVEAVGSYYVLGYYPSELAREGQFRRIEVIVRRSDARVSARQGYVRRQPGPAKGTGQIAQSVPSLAWQLGRALPESDLPLRVQSIALKGRADRGQVLLIAEVAGRDLNLHAHDGRFVETIEFALLTIDAGGRRANGRSAKLDLRLTPKQREEVLQAGARWFTVLELPSGHYHLRVAARTVNAGRSGSVFTDIDVPRFDKGSTVSAIALSSMRTAGAVTAGSASLFPQLPTSPTTVRTYVLGDVIHATAEVCPGANGPKPNRVTLTVESDDRNEAPAIRHLRPTPGQNGCGHVAFTLATEKLGPGRFVVRLDAAKDEQQSRATRVIEFRVIPDR